MFVAGQESPGRQGAEGQSEVRASGGLRESMEVEDTGLRGGQDGESMADQVSPWR